jgi:hypothetical protein
MRIPNQWTAALPSCRHPALAALCVLIAGCAHDSGGVFTSTPRTTAPYGETPVASNFQTTTQYKLQAGQHWLAISDDTGRWILAALKKNSACNAKDGKCAMLYVEPPTPVTGFSRAFHTQLVTTLVNQQVAVSKNSGSGLVVSIDVQPVLFTANRPQYRYAGTPVELAPGVWAIRDVTTTTPPNATGVPPSVDALHWFRSEFAAGQTPRAEVLVTTSIGDQNRYLARTTAVYYVADSDMSLYDRELCSLFELCSAEPAKKDTTATVKIIGDCPLDKPCPVDAPQVVRIESAPATPAKTTPAKTAPVKKKAARKK